MACFRTLVVPFLLLITLLLPVDAHSPPFRPLKRVAHPSTLALDVLPRRSDGSSSGITARSLSQDNTLLHSDSFRLTISAFGDTFHLHMSPNDHLIHPSATVKIINPGSSDHVVVPLEREKVLAYMGHVVPAEFSEDRMRQDISTVAFPDAPTVGWARIVVHSPGSAAEGRPPVYSGAFSAHGTTYHVATKDHYLKTKLADDAHPPGAAEQMDEELVIWRDSDVHPHPEKGKPKAQTCSHDSMAYNTDPMTNPFLLQSPKEPSWYNSLIPSSGNDTLSKRDDVVGEGMSTNFADQIGQTAGCPSTQQILFMGVAADCEYVQDYGSADNATTQILTDWNSASALYRSTFNVSLGILELQVMNSSCPSQADPETPWNVACDAKDATGGEITLNERLSLFSAWRGQKGNDNIGLWHLMSGCPTGSEVGVAWLATLCQQAATGPDDNVVSGTGVSTSGRTEWQVIAHEIGHNFGAIHDCDDGCNSSSRCCPLSTTRCDADREFIMSPVADKGETIFSQCSIGNICSVMLGVDNSQTNTTCFVDAATNTRQTISLQMCGNGILEPGEECDPGLGSDSSCCDPSTCRFTSGSVCDPDSGHTCCTAQCQFAAAGTICRPSRDSQCDFEEMCSGTNSTCPPDEFQPNGQSCGNDDLRCASGQCTSNSAQCRIAGMSMGLREACPSSDNSCQLSCQNPRQANSCIILNTMLVDGSPCGYGGSCVAGQCESNGFLQTAIGWYTQNLQLSIPITVVVGLIALAILACILKSIYRCIKGGRAPNDGRARLGSYDRVQGVPPRDAVLHAVRQGGVGPNGQQPQPQHQQHRSMGSGGSRSNWVDPSPYNGARGGL